MSKIMEQLKEMGVSTHCSRCGNDGEIKCYPLKGKIKYYVYCPKCGQMGADGNTPEKALVFWDIANNT